MNRVAIATPSKTAEILKKYDLTMKKSLGQNFLIDTNVLSKIVDVADIDVKTFVIEVGPGIGALTQFLAQEAKEVLAFEIDQRLIPILSDTLSEYHNVHVINEDILTVDLKAVLASYYKSDDRLSVVANLPYYITTPIIMHFLDAQLPIDTFVLMMQKEVAERMTAQPNSKAYGSLTIAIQYYMDSEIAFIVPKTVFSPQPKIDSAILKLTRRDTPRVDVQDEQFFFQLVKASFVQRRKTLWNNLIHHFGKDELTKTWLQNGLDESSITPSTRAEALSIEQFAQLSNALCLTKK